MNKFTFQWIYQWLICNSYHYQLDGYSETHHHVNPSVMDHPFQYSNFLSIDQSLQDITNYLLEWQ